MEDREFLIWLHYRITEVYKERPGMDFMWKLRSIIEAMPKDQITPNNCNKNIQELEND